MMMATDPFFDGPMNGAAKTRIGTPGIGIGLSIAARNSIGALPAAAEVARFAVALRGAV